MSAIPGIIAGRAGLPWSIWLGIAYAYARTLIAALRRDSSYDRALVLFLAVLFGCCLAVAAWYLAGGRP